MSASPTPSLLESTQNDAANAGSNAGDEAALDAPTFEQAVGEIEQILERIESGEVGLEQCLTQYEKGMKLIQRCRGILERAETRIAELTPDAQGNVRVEPGADAPDSPRPNGTTP